MAQRNTDVSSNSPNSIQVIEEIATHLNTDPTEVDFTFNDYVDPDALDNILESSAEQIVVAFTIEDMLVTVSSDGTVSVVDQNAGELQR